MVGQVYDTSSFFFVCNNNSSNNNRCLKFTVIYAVCNNSYHVGGHTEGVTATEEYDGGATMCIRQKPYQTPESNNLRTMVMVAQIYTHSQPYNSHASYWTLSKKKKECLNSWWPYRTNPATSPAARQRTSKLVIQIFINHIIELTACVSRRRIVEKTL